VARLMSTGSETTTEKTDDEALDAAQEVEDGLGTDDEVERRWQSRTVVKVPHPQLGPSELPLSISVILSQQNQAAVLTAKGNREIQPGHLSLVILHAN